MSFLETLAPNLNLRMSPLSSAKHSHVGSQAPRLWTSTERFVLPDLSQEGKAGWIPSFLPHLEAGAGRSERKAPTPCPCSVTSPSLPIWQVPSYLGAVSGKGLKFLPITAFPGMRDVIFLVGTWGKEQQSLLIMQLSPSCNSHFVSICPSRAWPLGDSNLVLSLPILRTNTVPRA